MLELHASKRRPCRSEGRGCWRQHLLTRLREGQSHEADGRPPRSPNVRGLNLVSPPELPGGAAATRSPPASCPEDPQGWSRVRPSSLPTWISAPSCRGTRARAALGDPLGGPDRRFPARATAGSSTSRRSPIGSRSPEYDSRRQQNWRTPGRYRSPPSRWAATPWSGIAGADVDHHYLRGISGGSGPGRRRAGGPDRRLQEDRQHGLLLSSPTWKITERLDDRRAVAARRVTGAATPIGRSREGPTPAGERSPSRGLGGYSLRSAPSMCLGPTWRATGRSLGRPGGMPPVEVLPGQPRQCPHCSVQIIVAGPRGEFPARRGRSRWRDGDIARDLSVVDVVGRRGGARHRRRRGHRLDVPGDRQRGASCGGQEADASKHGVQPAVAPGSRASTAGVSGPEGTCRVVSYSARSLLASRPVVDSSGRRGGPTREDARDERDPGGGRVLRIGSSTPQGTSPRTTIPSRMTHGAAFHRGRPRCRRRLGANLVHGPTPGRWLVGFSSRSTRTGRDRMGRPPSRVPRPRRWPPNRSRVRASGSYQRRGWQAEPAGRPPRASRAALRVANSTLLEPEGDRRAGAKEMIRRAVAVIS